MSALRSGLGDSYFSETEPYTTCLSCGVQNFYRGQKGIRRLREILDSDLLITANEPSVDAAVLLFNRMQQLRAQKKELTAKRGFVFSDSDSQNTTKIAQLQGELAKLARKSRRGKKK